MLYRLIPQAEFKPFRQFFQNSRKRTQREAEQSVEPEPRTKRFQKSTSTARGPVNAVVTVTLFAIRVSGVRNLSAQ
jgi:hypothetical protein